MFALGIASIIVFSVSPYPFYVSLYMSDKLEHAVAYAVVSLLGSLGFTGLRAKIAVGAGLVTLGIALEVVQRLVPGRLGEVADVAANTTGVVVGLLVAWALSAALPALSLRNARH